MDLPQAYLRQMQELLGEEYPAFLACYEQPAFRGVRLNPLKCTQETLAASLSVSLSPAPFSPLSFYAAGLERPGSLPAHRAGMFYSQEPSAASAVTVLDPQPGEKILDLCAAPGGKSTQIAALLDRKGLLWSNEIVRERTGALLSNLERVGAVNSVVSSIHPEKLCSALQGYFDRVLVDAPCSGEGMFRRQPEAIGEWTAESPAACAARQLKILDCAAQAVRSGGVLVYSTCTFSREENEEVVQAFLEGHLDFELLPIRVGFGRPGSDGRSLRIFPMDGGEGHFVALFRRTGAITCRVHAFSGYLSGRALEPIWAFYDFLFTERWEAGVCRQGDRIFLVPPDMPELAGLGVLRAGVLLGEDRGSRIEPAHGLFMCANKAICRQSMDFSPEDPALAAFFRGEEIETPCTGYTAVCVHGVTAGFGKGSGGRLKNRYPKGLRAWE